MGKTEKEWIYAYVCVCVSLSLSLSLYIYIYIHIKNSVVKNPPTMQVQSMGGEDPLEKEMATHSRIIAWGIPWTEELCGLQFMGLQRVRHDLVTKQQITESPCCIPEINTTL